MADVRCMYCYWQPNGHCHNKDPHLVYVPFIYYLGFSHYIVHGAGILDEHETVYSGSTAQSFMVFMKSIQ